MSRREYRIFELTHGDDSISFEVEYRTNAHSSWLKVCTRDSLDLAIHVVDMMKRGEVLEKKVVWND